MFIGHYALDLAAKRVAPNASLGTLVAAAQPPDLLWPIFRLRPGAEGGGLVTERRPSLVTLGTRGAGRYAY